MRKPKRSVRAKARPASRRRPVVKDAEVVQDTIPGTMRLVITDPAQLLPREPTADAVTLSDDPVVGSLGLVELKLTAEENQALDVPVKTDEVHIKPTGEVYLSHPAYTQWFNRAFGRLGWSVVPIGRPMEKGGLVVVPYVMTIHGKRVAMAYGEQQYSEKNKRQSYGEAVEATVASALRRFAKRLGVSLELWDKRFTHRFLTEHGVMVKVRQRDGEMVDQWRRRDDPPLPYEQGARTVTRREDSSSGQPPVRPVSTDGNAKEPITDGQRRKLWATLQSSKREESEFRVWLAAKYGVSSTKAITRGTFQAILDAVEKPGPLVP